MFKTYENNHGKGLGAKNYNIVDKEFEIIGSCDLTGVIGTLKGCWSWLFKKILTLQNRMKTTPFNTVVTTVRAIMALVKCDIMFRKVWKNHVFGNKVSYPKISGPLLALGQEYFSKSSLPCSFPPFFSD